MGRLSSTEGPLRVLYESRCCESASFFPDLAVFFVEIAHRISTSYRIIVERTAGESAMRSEKGNRL